MEKLLEYLVLDLTLKRSLRRARLHIATYLHNPYMLILTQRIILANIAPYIPLNPFLLSIESTSLTYQGLVVSWQRSVE